MQRIGTSLGILFTRFPGFGFGKVTIAGTCQVHRFGDRLTEAKGTIAFGNFVGMLPDRVQCLLVGIGWIVKFRNHPVEKPVRKAGGSKDKIPKNIGQLVVYAILKITP